MSLLDHPAATADASAFRFYDIESLHNIFTVAVYDNVSHDVRLYVQLDDEANPQLGLDKLAERSDEIFARVRAENPAWLNLSGENAGDLRIINLAKDSGAWALAHDLGGIYDGYDAHAPKAEDSSISPHYWPITDTNPAYDPKIHPFIVGYNSDNYDLTLLSVYFTLRLLGNEGPRPVPASEIRHHNDEMFSPEFRRNMAGYLWDSRGFADRTAGSVRRSMINSGRHLDIARLNETQSKVALKRLLGQMGHQILESDRLTGPGARVSDIDDVIDLMVYNVSDVIGTQLLFNHPVYSSTFDQRIGLLHSYPEVIYEQKMPIGSGADIRPTRVRKDRLRPTTTSARFAAYILAPYRALAEIPGHLADSPVVSFRYPAESVAKATGVPRVNVLTASRDFFRENVHDPTALAQFERVYDFYRSIEGRNFNETTPSLDQIVGGVHSAFDNLIPKAMVHEIQVSMCARDFARHFPTNGTAPVGGSHITVFTLDTLEPAIAAMLDYIGSINVDVDLQNTIVHGLKYILAFYRGLHDSQIPFDEGPNPEPIGLSWPPRRDDQPMRHHSLSLGEIATVPTNVAYFDSHGRPTRCFVNFSTGGIHGSEIDMGAFGRDTREFNAANDRFEWVLRCAIHQADHALKDPDADPKDRAIAEAADDWVAGRTDPAIDYDLVPEIAGPGGVAHDKTDVARAAWWLRNKLRINVTDPITGVTELAEHGDYIASGRRKNEPYWRAVPKNHHRQELFTDDTGRKREAPAAPPGATHEATKLNPKYVYTSVGEVIHEDFTSYYPLMLTNMAAFDNPDLARGAGSTDRYRDIFNQKEELGAKLKDPAYSKEEKDRFSILRAGTKLILNAASGAADANHDTPIRMNNNIAAMRVIGQLFSWRIGQAQTFAGAEIVSTNTDGLYSRLDFDTNQAVLDRYADEIGVAIEPESLLLVSKDSNNRVEMTLPEPGQPTSAIKILGASGATLAAHGGPNATKSMANPPIRDRVLAEYLKHVAHGHLLDERAEAGLGHANDPERDSLPRIDAEVDRELVREILDSLHETMDTRELLVHYQNLVAASVGSNTYLYAVPHGDVYEDDGAGGAGRANGNDEGGNDGGENTGPKPIPATDPDRLTFPGHRISDASGRREVTLLQHYNRIFLVDPEKVAANPRLGTPVNIAAANAGKVSESTKASRSKKGEQPTQSNPVARHLLTCAGADVIGLAADHDLRLKKHTGLDPVAPVIIFNGSIHDSADDKFLNQLVDSLDREAYVEIIAGAFETWRNRSLD